MSSTLDLIKKILDNQMNMPKGRVWAYNADFELPQDTGLFIVLSFASRTPYSNKSETRVVNGVFVEKQAVNVAEDIIISLISKDTFARDRCFEVLMALKSVYSQYVQENNHIHISTINDAVDSSFLEASARLNRFDIRCRVICTHIKEQQVDYYDKFSFELWQENRDNVNITKFEVQ